jgi:hypothetical protein
LVRGKVFRTSSEFLAEWQAVRRVFWFFSASVDYADRSCRPWRISPFHALDLAAL